MIVECEDCDESICADCDGEEIAPGRYICFDRNDERARLEAEAQVSNLPEGAEPQSCGKCGISTHFWIVKNEGVRCVRCAHALELELLGGEHDAASCQICTPSAKAA